MPKKTALLALLLIAACALSACTFLRLAHSSKLKTPDFAFLASHFQGANERQADLTFDLSAFNPNAIGLKNVTVGYELFYQDKRFMHGGDIALDLKPKDTTRIVIPASVVYREVFDVAGPVAERLLLNRKTFPVRVDAVMSGNPTLYDDKESGGLFSFTLHASRTVDVPIPQGLMDKAKSSVRGALRKMF